MSPITKKMTDKRKSHRLAVSSDDRPSLLFLIASVSQTPLSRHWQWQVLPLVIYSECWRASYDVTDWRRQIRFVAARGRSLSSAWLAPTAVVAAATARKQLGPIDWDSRQLFIKPWTVVNTRTYGRSTYDYSRSAVCVTSRMEVASLMTSPQPQSATNIELE